MLVAFTGDPYLARRALEHELRHLRLPLELVRPEALPERLVPGLFAEAGGAVDFRELKSETWALLKPLLEHLPESIPLLIYDPSPSAARSRWYKAHAEVRHLPAPRYGERVAFVQKEMKRLKVKAPPAVAQILAESEADTEGLVREVEKLALATPPITPAKALALIGAPAAGSAFDLLLPIAERRTAEALGRLAELLEKGEAPLRVLGALSWHYVRLYTLFLLDPAPRRPEEAARALHVSPFAARRLLAAAQRMPEARLMRSLNALFEAELAIKQGRDPVLALEHLITELARA